MESSEAQQSREYHRLHRAEEEVEQQWDNRGTGTRGANTGWEPESEAELGGETGTEGEAWEKDARVQVRKER